MGRRRSVVRRRTDSQGRAVPAEGFETTESGESEVEVDLTRLCAYEKATLARAERNGICDNGLRFPDSTRVRSNHAAGRVVGATVADVPRPLGVPRLRDLGGVPGRAISLGQLYLSVVLARTVWRRRPYLVWLEAGHVAGLVTV